MLKMIEIIKSICIETNALNLIIKACFNQKYEGKHHSLTYYFKKFIFNKIKLRHYEQEVVNYCCCLIILKNICEEILETRHLYESQKFIELYHY